MAGRRLQGMTWARRKGMVILSWEVIFAELGKVDTHLSEMLQRQNRVQRLSEGWRCEGVRQKF